MGAQGQPETPRPSVVTIGNFDGVHVGHRRLIGEGLALARERGWRSVALTFDRHPASVVRPESAPALLTDLQQKVELLSATGVDEVVVLPFDAGRAAESAEEFVREVVAGQLKARCVVVGSNFRFGHRQQGDVSLLAKLGAELGFEVRAVELIPDSEERTPVSSSLIRGLIQSGQLQHADRLLGRPHELKARLRDEPGPEGRVAVFEAGMCVPASGHYEGLLDGVPAPLEVRADELRSSALDGVGPSSTLRVQFLARAGEQPTAGGANGSARMIH